MFFEDNFFWGGVEQGFEWINGGKWAAMIWGKCFDFNLYARGKCVLEVLIKLLIEVTWQLRQAGSISKWIEWVNDNADWFTSKLKCNQ